VKTLQEEALRYNLKNNKKTSRENEDVTELRRKTKDERKRKDVRK
jgi:hypothetical protein